MGLRIKLFGEFRVWRGEDLIGGDEWGRQKTRSLLKLLLTRPGRVFSRDEITDSLWPATPPKSAEKSLRVTVSLLRKALEPNLEHGSDSRFVLQKRPGYTFDGDSDSDVDAWKFENLRRTARAAEEAGDPEEAIEGYRAALGLARGEFLAEDVYEEWAAEARSEWRERHLSVLSNLSECLALRGRYAEAVEVCGKALDLDAYREDLHRRLMLFHYCAGEQTHALRAYRRYARMMEEELGASPSPEMARMKVRIEARDVPGVDEARRYPKPRRPLKFPYSLSRTHFVGRDREYAMLVERLREAAAGSGGAVAIEGEAGVGKTRLAEEFLGHARSRGMEVLSGRCFERDPSPPLEPISDALGPLPNVADGLSGEDSAHPWTATLHEDGARIYRTLTAKLVEESRENDGLVLFVDDVQWADPATLDFLSYAARRVPGERVLMVMTYRREDAPTLSTWLDRLADRRATTFLSLDRLAPDDTMELLGRMSSRAFGELRPLADFLHRETEGNPFYVVEYLRWMIEAGTVLVDARRRISGMKSESLRDDALPSGIRALLRSRFAALSGEAQNLLKAAAVIGRSFDVGLLCEAASLGEDEALRVIEPLISAGLVAEVFGEEKYHFSHDKLRQALYEEIVSSRRRALHLRVAHAIEAESGDPSELAHHFVRARAWRPALENLIKAAKRAEDGCAWETALGGYAGALEVVGKLPGPEEEATFEILAARESLLEHVDRHDERAATVEEMFEIASRIGGKPRLAEVHVRRIGVRMALSDAEGATEAGEEALAMFREGGDPAGEARAHREMGYARWMSRDFAGALEANLQSLWIHRQLGYRRGEAGDAGNIAHVYRGLGDLDSALRWNEEAIRIDRELGDKLGEAFRLNSVASIQRERGDLEASLELHLKSIPLLAALGAKNLEATQRINCGKMLLGLGSPKDALEHFRHAARLGRQTGYARDEGYALMGVGACLENVGDFTGAADTYEKAAELLHASHELSEAPEELSGKADALTLLATVLHRPLEDPKEALEAYEEAAGIYRRLREPPKLRKLLMGLAALRWRTGDFEASAREYEEALDIAREKDGKAGEAAALASLCAVRRDAGDVRESIRRAKEALSLLRDLEDPQAEAYVLSVLADGHARLGHHPSALSCLKRSLRLRREVGDGKGEAGVLHDLAEVYEALGEKDLARSAVEKASAKKEKHETASIVSVIERRK